MGFRANEMDENNQILWFSLSAIQPLVLLEPKPPEEPDAVGCGRLPPHRSRRFEWRARSDLKRE
jgi:hypothetical protein